MSYETWQFKYFELLHINNHLNLCTKFPVKRHDLPEFQDFFLIGLLIQKPVFRKTITDRSKNIVSVQFKIY